MTAWSSLSSSPLAHRSRATRNTVMPASATSVACGSFSKFGICSDHGLALSRQVPATLAEHAGSGIETTGHGFERPVPFWRGDNARQDPLFQHEGAAEQDFPLVGEVTKKGALGHPRPSCDLGGRRLVESPFCIERERRLLQSTAAVRLPSAHGLNPRC
jgi:hypothetical protein